MTTSEPRPRRTRTPLRLSTASRHTHPENTGKTPTASPRRHRVDTASPDTLTHRVSASPPFTKGRRGERGQTRRPSQALTPPQHLRYSTPMATWSPEQREAALDQLRTGTTLAQTHHDTGIPKQTLSRWAKADGLDLAGLSQAKTSEAVQAAQRKWAERRADLADRIGDGTELALDQAIAFLAAGRPRDAKDAATTLGILVDKAQLLAGDATSRSEHLGLREQVADQAAELAPRLRAVS